MNANKKREGGFTLLELLIVVSIIAILSVALVVVLDPAEALRKSRDAQRISDMASMKTALGLYLTSTTTPYLGGVSANTACEANPGATTVPVSPTKIFYSLGGSAITATNLDGASAYAAGNQVAVANVPLTDGTGWIPVNFDTLIGGSPISNLPIDPVNTLASGEGAASVTKASLMYRYACSQTPLAFEIDAALESTAYTVSDDKRAKDGGNNADFYEVGTNLRILGTGNNF